MFDPRSYREACDMLALDTEKIEEMITMTENSKKRAVRRPARVALVAAALAAALCVTAAAAELPAVKEFFATVFVTVSVNGDLAADIDLPSVAVEEREGRSILVVNGEETDITDDLARKGEFLYEGDGFQVQVDENGVAIVTAYGEDGMLVTYSTELGGGENAVYTVTADESAEGGMRVQAVGLEDGKMVSYDVIDTPAAGE